MKALPLCVTVGLMIGLTAKADDRPVPVIVHEEMGMPVPFPNRNFADVLTSISEAPTGRALIRVGNAKNRELQDPHLEKRLDDIEKKLDRVLKELKDMKSPPKPTTLNHFDFSLGARY